MKFTTSILRCLASGAVAALCAPLLPGATQTYVDRATWEAAISGESTINFESGVPSQPGVGGILGQPVAGFTIGNASFIDLLSGSPGSGYAMYADNQYPTANWGTTVMLTQSDYGNVNNINDTLAISLTSAVNGFGIDLMQTGATSSNVTVVVNGQNYSVALPGYSTKTFFGITSDTAISSIAIKHYIDPSQMAFDNFSTGTPNATGPTGPTGGGGDTGTDPSPTPEAATMLLCASALFGMSKIRRLRRSRVSL